MREQYRSDWVEVELGEVFHVEMGQSPPSSTYNEDGVGLPFFQGKAEFTNLHPEIKKWCSEPKKTAEPGDLLISVRAPVGAVNIANTQCAIGRGLAAARYPFGYKFPLYFFQFIEKKLDEQGTGTTFRAISGKVLRSQLFPLPPLPEQRAIVAKLEQLFSELEQGIASLQTARKQLDTYRQAVLKQAFEGELTREWREQRTHGRDAMNPVPRRDAINPIPRSRDAINPVPRRDAINRVSTKDDGTPPPLPTAEALLDQIQEARAAHHAQQMAAWEQQVADWEAKGKEGKKPRKPGRLKKVSNESAEEQKIKYLIQDIPDTWVWVKVANVGEVQLGRQRSPKHHNGTHMRPYLRVANVFENRIDLSDILEMNFTPDEFETYELKDGDILLNEGQSLELVGRPAMYRGELPGACFQNTLVRFRPYSTLDRKFALHLMLTYFKLGEFQKIASWTTSIAHLGAGRFAELFVPVPSLPEQHQIVAEIESRLSVCDKLAETIETGLQQAEALRQSLLKKAFEGRLLSEAELAACRQEPDWEPAEQLLARIKHPQS